MEVNVSVHIDPDLGAIFGNQVKPSGFLYTTDFRVGGGVFCQFDPLNPLLFFCPFRFLLEAIQSDLTGAAVDGSECC